MELLGRVWEVTACDGSPQLGDDVVLRDRRLSVAFTGALRITARPPHAMWTQPWEDAMGTEAAADELALDFEAGALVRLRIVRRATLGPRELEDAGLAALLDADAGVPIGAQLVRASTTSLSVLGDPGVPAVLPRLPAGTALVSAQLGRTGVRDLSALAGQVSLRALELEGCAALDDLSPLRALHALETLTLAGTAVRVLAPIAGLAALRVLTLPARVDDLAVLGGLRALVELDLTRRELPDPSWLRGLVSLEVLDLTDTRVADLDVLAGATRLRRLRADRCGLTSLAPLAAHPLEALSVVGNRGVVDVAPIARAALRDLNLHGTRVASLAPLAACALVSLSLSHTDIADLGPLAAQADLRSLNLFSTLVADLAPLAGISALRDLDLFCSRVTDLTPLRKANLERLELRWTKITDLAPLAHHRWTLRRLALDAALLPALRALDGALITELVVRDDHAPLDLAALTALPQLATLRLDHAYGGLPSLAGVLKLPKLTRLIAPGLSAEARAALTRARPGLVVT